MGSRPETQADRSCGGPCGRCVSASGHRCRREISTDASFGSIASRATTRALAGSTDGRPRSPPRTHRSFYRSFRAQRDAWTPKTFRGRKRSRADAIAVACCQSCRQSLGRFRSDRQEASTSCCTSAIHLRVDEAAQTGLASSRDMPRSAARSIESPDPILGARIPSRLPLPHKTTGDARLQALHARFPYRVWTPRVLQ